MSGGVVGPGLLQVKSDGPTFFTGGTFGMEQSIFALILCTVTGIVMLRIAIGRGHTAPAPWNRKGQARANGVPSLPLNRSRRLARHVVDDAADTAHLVDDAGTDSGEEGVVEGVAFGRHAIG